MPEILQFIADRERALENEAAYRKEQAEHWEKKYWDSVMGSIKHGEEQMANMVSAAIAIAKGRP